jgi:Holliday junction resolvasome RuvABC endonuclease subunit
MRARSRMLRKITKDNRLRLSVGIDVSLTSTGVYLLYAGTEEADGLSAGHTIKTDSKQKTESSRIDQTVNSFFELLAQSTIQPSIVCIEDYGPIGRFAGKITSRAELCGVIKHVIRNYYDCEYVLVPPLSLKKYATGNGRAKKPDMANRAKEFGLFNQNTDVVDAFFCARFGEALLYGRRVDASYTRVYSENQKPSYFSTARNDMLDKRIG